MATLLPIVLLLPLTGAILNGLILRNPNPKVSGAIATLFSSASFVGVLLLCQNYFASGAVSWSVPWMEAGSFSVDWGLRFDALTVVMGIVVTGIGTLIHLYSIGYMDEEKTPYRFFAYLNLFLFSMLLLILGDSLPVLFVGWEGVGFCSYVLIGYWYEDLKKADAGMKAFVINRIGDAGFLLGIFICFWQFKAVDFGTMNELVATSNSLDPYWLSMAAFCLFVGAMGKSAQIPLYTWLPDAMAGPTPVSALIHAATMVTAGIYLLCRMSFLYQVTPLVGQFVAFIGAFTALFAASIATAQTDIKKVLAYSTVSQLGFMFVALGVGAYTAAIFHVMTHAFFKALLFLGAGSIIHGLEGEQDLCQMGGLRKHFPVTFITCTIAVAAICGLPPFAGFFSKDTIVFAALSAPKGNVALWAVLCVASLLTAFYMSRMYFLTFFGKYRGSAHPHEGGWVMNLPLIFLAVGSAFAGFLGMPHGLHLLPNYLDKLLVPTIPAWTETHVFLSEMGGMVVAVGIALTGILIAYRFYIPGPERSEKMAAKLSPVHMLLKNKYWIDELYGLIFVLPFERLSLFLAKIFDPKVVDGAILLPARLAKVGATTLGFLQLGAVQFYLWVMVLGALIMFWFSVRGLVG